MSWLDFNEPHSVLGWIALVIGWIVIITFAIIVFVFLMLVLGVIG